MFLLPDGNLPTANGHKSHAAPESLLAFAAAYVTGAGNLHNAAVEPFGRGGNRGAFMRPNQRLVDNQGNRRVS